MKDKYCVSCEHVIDCNGSNSGGKNCINYIKREPNDSRSLFEKVCDEIAKENERRVRGNG